MAEEWNNSWTEDPNQQHLLVPTASTSVPRGRRKSNFTQQEVNMLCTMMRKYAKRLRGRITSGEDLGERRKLWMKIVDAVNSVSVEERTLTEIKSKWKKCRYEDELGKKKFFINSMFSGVWRNLMRRAQPN